MELAFRVALSFVQNPYKSHCHAIDLPLSGVSVISYQKFRTLPKHTFSHSSMKIRGQEFIHLNALGVMPSLYGYDNSLIFPNKVLWLT